MGNGFTSHAVLQSNTFVPLWGEAPVGAEVEVTMGKEHIMTVADGHGRWEVLLPKQKPSVKPVKITATCQGETCEILDVVFGDVWMGAGTALDSTNLQRLNISSADTEVRLLFAPTSGTTWSDWQKAPVRTHGKAKRVVGIISAGVERGKIKSWSTPSGKWNKRILQPLSPYPLRGILWYDGANAATLEDLETLKTLFRESLGAPNAEFRK